MACFAIFAESQLHQIGSLDLLQKREKVITLLTKVVSDILG